MRQRSGGFTLVEIMVASSIGAFIALVTVGMLRFVSVSSEQVNIEIDAAAELEFAAKKLAEDLSNTYRGRDRNNMKFVLQLAGSEEGVSSVLNFYTISRTKTRLQQPEGDVYEVEYLLISKGESAALYRRQCANPHDSENLPQMAGVMTELAQGVDVFMVEVFDGEKWYNEWIDEEHELPELVQVILSMGKRGSRRKVEKSFLVNFVKDKGGRATLDDEGTTIEGAGQSND